MTAFKRGDIVLVPFPFTDFSTLKQRPALVISSDAFNRSREDVILVAITSQNSSAFKGGNYSIKGAEQKRSGLLGEGVVLVGKIITIDQRLIRSKLGILSPKVLEEISKRISKIIG
ncbi:MAG: type II toxin-antitoxin system PemK/MazF family toxin [bacterium]|nr:type II toxin-antitoxin system PemK/MazF family toxin [bacterium]